MIVVVVVIRCLSLRVIEVNKSISSEIVAPMTMRGNHAPRTRDDDADDDGDDDIDDGDDNDDDGVNDDDNDDNDDNN